MPALIGSDGQWCRCAPDCLIFHFDAEVDAVGKDVLVTAFHRGNAVVDRVWSFRSRPTVCYPLGHWNSPFHFPWIKVSGRGIRSRDWWLVGVFCRSFLRSVSGVRRCSGDAGHPHTRVAEVQADRLADPKLSAKSPFTDRREDKLVFGRVGCIALADAVQLEKERRASHCNRSVVNALIGTRVSRLKRRTDVVGSQTLGKIRAPEEAVLPVECRREFELACERPAAFLRLH